MKLEKKRALASRALGVGKERIIFNVQRLSEIKEAITRKDIKDLKEAGAITIKEKQGRRKIKKRKTRKRAGKIKKKVTTRKQDYIVFTRKLRSHLKHKKAQKAISSQEYKDLRKKIRIREFRSLSHMKDHLAQLRLEKK